MKLRPLGDINHDLEYICVRWIDKYSSNWSTIIQTFHSRFKTFKSNQEIYCVDDTFPVLKLKKVSPIKLSKYDEGLLDKLLKEYFIAHDMQWGEVLAQVYQYLQTHFPEKKDRNFIFYYGP